jgi:MarR family transcriptional regulator, organic hydroperoxide resistance regulator
MKRPGDVLDGPEVPPLGGVLDFMRLMWALDHALQAASKRMLAHLGVTGPQRLALRLIGRFPGISAGRLARVMHIHPSTLTGILARLEERRLVTRRPDPDDARRALFGLTPKGQRLNDDGGGTIEAAVARALASVPAARLREAETVLAALIGAVEGGPDGAP